MSAEIWRMPAEGGSPVRIANGSEPQESPDGDYLYHVDRPPQEGPMQGRLMRTPLRDGPTELVIDGVAPLYWSVTDKGIFFLRRDGVIDSIYRYRFRDQKIERTGKLPFRVAAFPQGRGRLAVSRDGRWALVNVTDRWEGDLMLLDNFR
jgi:hypothetical protein